MRKLHLGQSLLFIVVIPLVAFAVLGEIYLRVAYDEGLSFGDGGGPIKQRFERDFRFNRFDGPSRGPEAIGPKSPGEVRLLIQGDSITWGQGVRSESDLFSTRLLEGMKGAGLNVTIAVLAKPGRDIDEHLEQLRKWGDEIAPDIIVYQWYVNDIELNNKNRPMPPGRFWREAFFHRTLRKHSYLYFFLDYRIDSLLPAASISYSDYFETEFAEGTAAWRNFTRTFKDWTKTAKSRTSRILVVLYPHVGNGFELPELMARTAALCREAGVEVLDLTPALRVYEGNFQRLYASPFDAHPSAEAHATIAAAIQEKLVQSWPELVGPHTRLD